MISSTNHTFSAQTLMAYLQAVAKFPGPAHSLLSYPSFSRPAALTSLSLFLLSPPTPMGKKTPEASEGLALVCSTRNPKALK